MSIYQSAVKVEIFGSSHASAIGVTMTGLPAGLPVDILKLQAFLARRAPGRFPWQSSRKEPDVPVFRSGVKDGLTDGTPLTAEIENCDIRRDDYTAQADTPRPGHADYPARMKYGPDFDLSGGGPFSGRMTAPLCIAGGLCREWLKQRGVAIDARILAIGPIRDDSLFSASVEQKPFPVVDDVRGEDMIAAITAAKQDGDSLGGIVECQITGLPVGLGGPLFDGLESRISPLIFAIPAVKGVEFGDGFAAAALRGSEHNDPYRIENGAVVSVTNHAGGILGGMATGAPLIFRAACKPTPSIAKPQQSVSLSRTENTTMTVSGRHDPCIVPRAVPCVEAAAAIAIFDAFLSESR